jgi:hypothetical protein
VGKESLFRILIPAPINSEVKINPKKYLGASEKYETFSGGRLEYLE